LMGTFSKALGTTGGYVTGSRDLIYYLRFYANPGLFTASLPAPLCAGVAEAFRILEEEPEHRERLWNNIRHFTTALQQAGFRTGGSQSPIVTIPVGSEKLLWTISCALFDRGLKCGNVAFPAVPRGEAILRLTVNARHTREDLDQAVEILASVGSFHGILGKRVEELEKGEQAHA
ncbi:MAG TPA: aminotransferase class I/II-fold pyridoxal phosphate-dependent enzyme, partial [Chroococcales cyanobacterium]